MAATKTNQEAARVRHAGWNTDPLTILFRVTLLRLVTIELISIQTPIASL